MEDIYVKKEVQIFTRLFWLSLQAKLIGRFFQLFQILIKCSVVQKVKEEYLSYLKKKYVSSVFLFQISDFFLMFFKNIFRLPESHRWTIAIGFRSCYLQMCHIKFFLKTTYVHVHGQFFSIVVWSIFRIRGTNWKIRQKPTI